MEDVTKDELLKALELLLACGERDYNAISYIEACIIAKSVIKKAKGEL